MTRARPVSLAAALLAAVALALGGCGSGSGAPGVERPALLAPDFVARAARATTQEPQARWLLGQPHSVRESYVHEVPDRGDRQEAAATAWLLRQPDSVRASY